MDITPEIIQACIEASPLLQWLNNPDNTSTFFIIAGIELLLHVGVFVWLHLRMIDVIMWTGHQLWRGLVWYRTARLAKHVEDI